MRRFDSPGQRTGAARRTVVYILAGVGGVLLLSCFLCGGGIYLALNWAEGSFHETFNANYRDHPMVQEHIGEVKTMSVDFADMAEVKEERGDPDYLSFYVVGTKGEGQVVVLVKEGLIDTCELIVPAGTFQLE
ncbi:hypothetical protein [Bremerella cremea]|uniref:hypothetical protein n=1 Tax=Bremerella cremea TaxID=1031537 RepID=UPI0031EC9E98